MTVIISCHVIYDEVISVFVSFDEDPLMSTFIVFMHTMLSAAIDPSFLATILQNEEGLTSFATIYVC